jgi:hypothetical protein
VMRFVKSDRRCVRLIGEIYGGYFPCRVVYVRAIACCLVDREQIG